MCHVFTKSHIDVPEVKRAIYPGSSSGDLVGPINLETFADRAWQVTEEEKKKLYGPFRIAVGGNTETAPQESGKRPTYKRAELRRKLHGDEAQQFEPLSYAGMPPEFYEDLIHVWTPKAVIDFTASDLTPAYTCLEKRVPYLGVCWTEAHVVAGYKHLAELVFEGMKKESSPLHDPKLCALVQKLDPSAKAAPKRTSKRAKKNKVEEENEEGDENEGEEGEGGQEGQGQDGDGAVQAKKKPRKGTGSNTGGGGGGSSLNDLMSQLKNLRGQ